MLKIKKMATPQTVTCLKCFLTYPKCQNTQSVETFWLFEPRCKLCCIFSRSWLTSKWPSVGGWWTVRVGLIPLQKKTLDPLQYVSWKKLCGRVTSCFLLCVRCAGDGGFCGSRWSSDVQDVWEGKGQSRLPDGENRFSSRWFPVRWSQTSDSFFPSFFQGTANPDRALTVAQLVWV